MNQEHMNVIATMDIVWIQMEEIVQTLTSVQLRTVVTTTVSTNQERLSVNVRMDILWMIMEEIVQT
jgi:hypothetical protein